MSVGFEDACDLEYETWARQTGEVDEVEARFPDNGRNRQRIATSAYQRAGTIPASGLRTSISSAKRGASFRPSSVWARPRSRLDWRAIPRRPPVHLGKLALQLTG